MKDLMHEVRDEVEREVWFEVINRVSYNVAGKVRREVEWKVPPPGLEGPVGAKVWGGIWNKLWRTEL